MNINTHIPKNITRNEKGSILLEFVGCVVIIAFLYLALITIALRVDEYSALPKIARDCGRQAAMSGNIDEGYQKANETAWALGLDTSKLDVQISEYSFGARQLIDSKVNYVSSPFDRMFPKLVGGKAIGEKELSSKVTFGWWDYEDEEK